MAELEGFPDDELSKLEKDKEREGAYFIRVSLAYPEIKTALKLVKSERVREKVSKALDNKAAQNEPILEELIQKRTEIAKLFGLNSFSEYVTEHESLMVKKPSTIESFIDDLAAKMHDKGHKEFEEVLSFKRQLTKNESAGIEEWDLNFYKNL